MELTTMQLYWIIKLDTFHAFSVGISIILIVALACIAFISDMEDEWKVFKVYFKYFIWIFPVFLFLATFLPTTKEMAAIIVLPKIINNEKLQEIPNKVLDLGLEWLDELKPTNEPAQ